MSKIDEQLRKAMRAHADRFDPRPEPWEKLQARSARRSRPSLHLILVSSIVVLAAGSVLGLRLLSDRESDGFRVVSPPLSSPSIAISVPTPTLSPSPEPSSTPEPTPSDGGVWTSPDGTWTVRYPEGWFLGNAGPDRWNLTNYRAGEGRELKNGEFGITLRVKANADNWSLDDLLNFYCEGAGDPEVKILDCRKVEYGEETWAWALGHDDVYGGNTDVFAGFILGGKLYQATAIVPDGSRAQTGRSEVDDILGTFTIG